jgi:flagellar biosynthesis protein FlhA
MSKDPEILTEYCRQKLARSILKSVLPPGAEELSVVTLDPAVEDLITAGIQQSDQGTYLSIDPGRVQAILSGLNKALESVGGLSQPPVVLCSPVVRRHFRRLVERFAPTLVVLSHNELVMDINLKTAGVIKPTAAKGAVGKGA